MTKPNTAAVLIVLLAAPLPARANPPPALYTAEQSTAGQAAYATACAACHGLALQGITGPKLTGQDFAKPADHYSLGLIFTNLWESTPAGAPDSLTNTQYVNIMAYLLEKNGFPPGPTALTFAGAQASKVPFASRVK